ncbi:Arsenate reductase [Caballeronia glathei]|uniref:Arsenate reductase n=1 Tax=Caballeronia glathei TaxID=60547 RepID=A0A069PSJ6_9BURK|nr:arsenate reductase ArsC [Caballeronia glathei]KDR40261.1 arsenate reductase [Caballeronia glathei]CDY74634.1 Arsenate reductase [Caballeronia glathei]
MTEQRKYKVLFLCTHNSARSILAEAALNEVAGDRFVGYSAGSHPGTGPNPFALDLLRAQGISTDGLRSKSWDEFAEDGAPQIDFIFTVCDDAAGEVCPIWPGRPAKAHWGVPDPSTFEGTDEGKRRAFLHAFVQMRKRIELFVNLPLEKLDRMAVQQEMQNIGTSLREKGE